MRGQGSSRIETGRLILRHFRDEDLATFYAYRNDPEVARYQSWERISEREARFFIEEMQEAQPGTPGEWFQFAIELKEGAALIGDCALKISAEPPYQGEIGYTLAREHQGRGLASEAIRALLDYSFSELQLHRVVASADCENTRSLALMERVGMRREGHFLQSMWFKGRWSDDCMYAILRDEWQEKKRMKDEG